MKKIKNNCEIFEISNHLLKDSEDIFAGRHVLLDLFSDYYSKNMEETKLLLEESIKITGATILFDHFHKFGEHGYTGIFVLSESHFSIHTWPEVGLITIDSYMCGICNPKKAINYIVEKMKPEKFKIKLFKRGILDKKRIKLLNKYSYDI